MLIQITSPYFCAGIELQDGKVVRQAPILGYMFGWTLDRVKEYCDRKDWEIEGVEEKGYWEELVERRTT